MCIDQYFFVSPRIVLLNLATPSFADLWYAVTRRASSLVYSKIGVLSFCVIPYRSGSVIGYVAYSSQYASCVMVTVVILLTDL